MTLTFTAYIRPEPQGSAKAFVIGGKARITSDNSKMKPYRSEVTRNAIAELAGLNVELPWRGKHVPVCLHFAFYFRKPESTPKKRAHPVVKPDLDKLARATMDALTGVVFHDDAQVVELSCAKFYGDVERVEITATEVVIEEV